MAHTSPTRNQPRLAIPPLKNGARLSRAEFERRFFFKAQLMPGLAAMSLTAFTLSFIAFDKALASHSVGLPVAVEPQSSKSLCPAQLGAAIDAVINRPQLRKARWGILIEPLSPQLSVSTSTVNQDHALYRHDAERYFIPASNVKLLTTAAALHQLGSEFRIRTSVYVSEAVPTLGASAAASSLRVVGRGDPSLTAVELRELAQQLKRQGVRNVQQLVVDDGYFQGNAINLTWEWEDIQADYGTSVNSLILNQNAVELTISPQKRGQSLRVSWSDAIAARQWRIENDSVTAEAAAPPSVTVTGVLGQPVLRITGQLAVDAQPESFGLAILDPAEYFLQHFRSVLATEGISVEKASVVSKDGTAGERELAAVESPPLSVLLVEINQESNNLYAEALLRSLQASAQPSLSSGANTDSADRGLSEVRASLTDLGVDPQSYVLADGSGLSRHNLVSPEAIAQTLKLMAQTPLAGVYRASLPIAGVTGTLQGRFLNTPAQGNLQAKTGTLSGVSALSGYLDVPGYQPLVVSIMVNQSDQSTTTLRQAIDEIVLLLTRLRCSSH